jgi:hypothetical protein
MENFKALSSSSPIFALSNHTIFCQTQTGATVPFKLSPADLELISRQVKSEVLSTTLRHLIT